MSKLQFTNGCYGVYGLCRERNNRPSEHARALAHGLDLLGPHYVCSICEMCKGSTVNREWYGCSYCEGTGLTQAFGCAATVTQRHQVLIAASRSLLLDFDVEVL